MSTTLENPPIPPYPIARQNYPLPYQQLQALQPKQTATSTPPPSPCACTQGAALTVQRGATLSTKLTLTVTDKSVTPPVTSPVDVTGNTFQFTAKVDPTYADTDPTTVKVDWHETSTPTQGITWLVVPAATTQAMQTIAYVMQIWMISASGVVTPLVQGTLTITQSISARAAGPIVNPV
jgi:hypothetical protein